MLINPSNQVKKKSAAFITLLCSWMMKGKDSTGNPTPMLLLFQAEALIYGRMTVNMHQLFSLVNDLVKMTIPTDE